MRNSKGNSLIVTGKTKKYSNQKIEFKNYKNN